MVTGPEFLQFATGAFFVTTGYRKVFRPEVHKQVVPFIMRQARVPRWVAEVVIHTELIGGIWLVLGTFTRFVALALLGLMAVAYVTTIWPEVREEDRGEHWTKLLSNALCTPEAQIILILIALVISGGY